MADNDRAVTAAGLLRNAEVGVGRHRAWAAIMMVASMFAGCNGDDGSPTTDAGERRPEIEFDRTALPTTCTSPIFVAPLSSTPLIVTSPYGPRGEKKDHLGTDFRARWPLPVAAAADGRVFKVDNQDSGPGLNLTLKHVIGGTTYYTRYLHLSEVLIQAGFVKAGQTVALTGQTGGVDPHLHFDYGPGSNIYVANPTPCINATFDGGSVVFQEALVQIKIQQSLGLHPLVKNHHGEEVDVPLEWKSSNTAIATVTNAGVVTGVARGRVTLTATRSGDVSGRIDVRVVPVPTGTLTLSPTSCTIASGASSCNVNATWTTKNPLGTSAITSNTPSANTQVELGNSGTSVPVAVLHDTRTFFLYNDALELARKTATSSCVSGTSWNGSVCAPPPPAGTLTLSPTSCTIAAGASSCDVNATWNTTNPVGTSAITSNTPNANTQVTTGNSGSSVPVAVLYNTRTFFLYNNAQELAKKTATSSCASGTSWTGSKCMGPMSGTLTSSPSSCVISKGASTCSVTISWSTTNPWNTSAVTSEWPNAGTEVASGNSSSKSVDIPYNKRNFYLYNSGDELAQKTVTSSCTSGTSWTGSKCEGPMSGTLTSSASSCTIPAGEKTCNVTISWSTTNPWNTSAVTSEWPSAGTQVATANSGSSKTVQIPYNKRNFYLYNSGVELAKKTVTSSCAAGRIWNGTTC